MFTIISQAIKSFFRLSYELEMLPPIWKYYKTKGYRELMATFEVITEYTLYKYIQIYSKLSRVTFQSDSETHQQFHGRNAII